MSPRLAFHRPAALLPALVLSACASTGAPQKCATVDLEPILRDSLPAIAARNRLNKDFEPQYASVQPLTDARKRAEKTLVDAKQDRQPDGVLKSLRQQYDDARTTELAAWHPVTEAFKKRKQAELDAMVDRTNVLYKKLGTERGYDLLYQVGWKEPAYVLNARDGSLNCQGGKDDLNKEMISVLDREEPPLP